MLNMEVHVKVGSMLSSMLSTGQLLNMELNMEPTLTWITWNVLNMEFHVKP